VWIVSTGFPIFFIFPEIHTLSESLKTLSICQTSYILVEKRRKKKNEEKEKVKKVDIKWRKWG
jgi:hypothetical protein